MIKASPRESPWLLQWIMLYKWSCLSHLELESHHSLLQVLGTELQELMLALLDFGLALVPFLSIPLFLPFTTGTFTLCHCFLELFNFLIYFYKSWQPRVCLKPQRETLAFSAPLKLLNLGDSWEGLNASLHDQRPNVMVCIRMCPSNPHEFIGRLLKGNWTMGAPIANCDVRRGAWEEKVLH